MRKVWKVLPGLRWNILIVHREKDSDSIIPTRQSLADAVTGVIARVIAAAVVVRAAKVKIRVVAAVVDISKVF